MCHFCFSEESKRRGFTAIIDSRDGSWSNLVTVLGCLKVGTQNVNNRQPVLYYSLTTKEIFWKHR